LAPTALHAHHAFQVMLAPRGALLQLGDGDGGVAEARGFVVGPGAPHAIRAPSPVAIVLWVDPDDHDGRRLRAALPGHSSAEHWASDGRRLEALDVEAPAGWEQASAAMRELLEACGAGERRPSPRHPGVVRVLRTVPERLDGDLRAAVLAAEAGVSPSRLAHLLREQVGTTLRAYVRWCRLRRAVDRIREGETLTGAAHAAGFADSAHMSRTFRRMFGVTPSDAIGTVEWISPER